MKEELKPCPFCGGGDIRYSMKTTGRWATQYHATMYCNTCHCYGRRTLTKKVERGDYEGVRAVTGSQTVRQKAIDAWNRRIA